MKLNTSSASGVPFLKLGKAYLQEHRLAVLETLFTAAQSVKLKSLQVKLDQIRPGHLPLGDQLVQRRHRQGNRRAE